MLAVYGGCDVMVEGERIPGEAAVRPKRRRDPLEAAATIGPRGQMQQRPRRGSRSGPPAPRFQAPVCLLRAGRARLPRQLRAVEPARASPAKSRSRLHAGPLPEQPGSQRARYQPQARPVARQPHGQARRRTGRQRRDGGRPLRVSVRPGVVPARHGDTNLRASQAGALLGQCLGMSPDRADCAERSTSSPRGSGLE